MSTPNGADPIGGARNLHFVEPLKQCENATIEWTGGYPPVRLELYQQENSTTPWQTIEHGMFNVDYSLADINGTHSFSWYCNVQSYRNVWAVIVDHTGEFSQHQRPYRVGAGDRSACLMSDRLANATSSDSNGVFNPLSVALVALLGCSVIGVAALSFWIFRLRKRLKRTNNRFSTLSAAAKSQLLPRTSSGVPAAAAGLAASRSQSQRSKGTATIRTRSLSLDSIRSLPQPNGDQPYEPAASTWNSGQNPFSDQYATLGSEMFASGTSSDHPTTTFNSADLRTSSSQLIGSFLHPHSATASGEDLQMAERQSIRSEPASVLAHSIQTEATMASSNSSCRQSDTTTVASERDRLGADLYRNNSNTTSGSSQDAPQFFPVSVNPAQLLSWRKQK